MFFGTSLYDLPVHIYVVHGIPRPSVSCCFWIDNFCMFTSQRQKAKKLKKKEGTEAKHSLVLSHVFSFLYSFCFGFLYHKLHERKLLLFWLLLLLLLVPPPCALLVLTSCWLYCLWCCSMLPCSVLLSCSASSAVLTPNQTQLLSQSNHIVVITAICKWQLFLALPPAASAFKIKLIICEESSLFLVHLLLLFLSFALWLLLW